MIPRVAEYRLIWFQRAKRGSRHCSNPHSSIMWGPKHWKCLISMVSMAQPSESTHTKNSFLGSIFIPSLLHQEQRKLYSIIAAHLIRGKGTWKGAVQLQQLPLPKAAARKQHKGGADGEVLKMHDVLRVRPGIFIL